jgi:hypothetical protein
MLKIDIYFCSADKSSAIYLPGISKRLNALGFQPIASDRFRFEDLNKKDQQLITEACNLSTDSMEVRDRDFSFGIKFSTLNIYLGVPQSDKNRSSHESFYGQAQIT